MRKLLRLPGDLEILLRDLQTQLGRSKAQISTRYRRRQADQDIAAGLNGRVCRGLRRLLSALDFPEQGAIPGGVETQRIVGIFAILWRSRRPINRLRLASALGCCSKTNLRQGTRGSDTHYVVCRPNALASD